MLFAADHVEHLSHSVIGMFYTTVSIWMVCSAGECFNAEKFINGGGKLCAELELIVG